MFFPNSQTKESISERNIAQTTMLGVVCYAVIITGTNKL